VNLENVTRDDWIVGGLALLLVIALLFFPWFTVSLGPLGSSSYSATGAPDGWLGILAFIAALAVIADLAVERLSPQTVVPSVGGSRVHTRFVLAAVAAGFVVLKFLFHIHFSGIVKFGWGFYFCVVVAAALVYFAAAARSAALAGPPAPRRPAAPTPPAGGTGGSTPPPGV
jgi:hypothetical protein